MMEVENYPKWKETHIGDTPIFHFHDYGRKGTSNMNMVDYSRTPNLVWCKPSVLSQILAASKAESWRFPDCLFQCRIVFFFFSSQISETLAAMAMWLYPEQVTHPEEQV